MNRWIAMTSLAAALALPVLLSPATASASCYGRKVTGTVVGGVGGALIGNSISHGGGGAVVGGLGGAVLGHEVARSTCGGERRGEYRSSYYSHRSRRGYRQNAQDQRYAYYDQRGNPVSGGGGAYATNCTTKTQSYYDDRGALVQRPVQTCGR